MPSNQMLAEISILTKKVDQLQADKEELLGLITHVKSLITAHVLIQNFKDSTQEGETVSIDILGHGRLKRENDQIQTDKDELLDVCKKIETDTGSAYYLNLLRPLIQKHKNSTQEG